MWISSRGGLARTGEATRSTDVANRPGRVHIADMSKTRSDVLEESRRKGLVAGAATAATVGAAVFLTGGVAIVAAVPTAFLLRRWWKHRAENGIKF
jgi:hypothetical protein